MDRRKSHGARSHRLDPARGDWGIGGLSRFAGSALDHRRDDHPTRHLHPQAATGLELAAACAARGAWAHACGRTATKGENKMADKMRAWRIYAPGNLQLETIDVP